MRKTVLAVAGLMTVVGSISASAADLRASKAPAAVIAPVPYYNWNGFYIGGHIGGLWSDKEASTNVLTPGTSCPNDDKPDIKDKKKKFKYVRHGEYSTQHDNDNDNTQHEEDLNKYKEKKNHVRPDNNCVPPSARNAALRQGYDVDGFLAGGQIGYNWHLSPNWVIGVEGQISWTNADGGVSTTVGGVTGTFNTEFNWIATATGRLGYAVNNMLFYVKGGAAWVDEDHHVGLTGPGGSVIGSVGDTRSGWIIGGGVEYGFGNNWSAKLEYNYMDFGSESYTVNIAGIGPHSFDIDQQVHVVKFGINYRFGWANPVVARY